MTIEDFAEALKRRNAPPAVCPTEDDLAAEFTRRHRHHLRYVARWGAWMHWDGRQWEREPTLKVFDLARAVCRDAGEVLHDPKLRTRILSATTRAAVENLARSDRAHAAVPEQWDGNLWHLNTPGGIVDLKTATIHPHDPLGYHTKIAAIGPAGDCPLWRDFLNRITEGDDELQAYLQRSAGYALTGSIQEHVLQFGYGTGANGKSTYLNTLTGIMGDYACTAPMETFTATSGERHPTDLAMLRGARLVTAQETEQGRQWAEAKIKALTGGDPVSARFMRQDFFSFTLIRAVLKANEICAAQPEHAAKQLVERRFTEHYEYALETLSELPYASWREFDAEDSLRFFALRLHEVGMISSSPNTLLAEGTDWRFLNEIKRELKA